MPQERKRKAKAVTKVARVSKKQNVAKIQPTEPRSPEFPIVGIGASAGGLAAFEAFFSGMPAKIDPDMAFVLVQHLDPDHKSMLTELIRRYTHMKVFEVEDGMKVQPNCAYIIPPNYDMAFMDGTLQLMPPAAPHGQRLPIDYFFKSLAQDQGKRAICVVLSGTGSDGSLGVRAIKEKGGMAMAQHPDSAEYNGMPRSAISTGLVDYELPPAAMPEQIIAYVKHAFGKMPITVPVPAKAGNMMKKIFVLLRSRMGHDFSQYKPSTILRRIERRMAIQQIETLEEYFKYLQQSANEVEALFRDMLIGVTDFFRDPEAFKVLEKDVIPKIFAGKPAGGTIRVWTAGCSTGEEAYSIAILLAEHQETLKQSYRMQVFATDIDNHAIAAARAGYFTASVTTNISPERLARYFVAETGDNDAPPTAYRIHKSIRDMLVFSEQDVIKDPPFSRLDLISCRNLMIYMSGDLQKKIIPLFHYALNPGGFLFLGTSETVGEFGDLFATLDRKAKVYEHKADSQGSCRGAFRSYPPAATMADATLPASASKAKQPVRASLRELTEQAILRRTAPVAVLVNDNGDTLYQHGRTGMYLEPTPGEPGINNIVRMAREGLRRGLAAALHTAVVKKESIRSSGLSVKTNGGFTAVNLTVTPVDDIPGIKGDGQYLVILENAPVSDVPASPLLSEKGGVGPSRKKNVDAQISALKEELRSKEEYLQSTNEELETSNEELKSSNEEMQSVNEELQSTNEELETSKEELQSVNEELATVNAELQTKVADLSHAINDMNNLLAGTGIGTVFVDHQLRILRFTPAVTKIINLIQSDIGRPVSHIVDNLVGYGSLVADVKTVLDTLIPKDVEVQTRDGKWYALHIQTYRTLENVIEGAVITFTDITKTKEMEQALHVTLAKYKTLFDCLPIGIAVANEEGKIVETCPVTDNLFGRHKEGFIMHGISSDGLSVLRPDGTPMPSDEFPCTRALKEKQLIENVEMGLALDDDTLTWVNVTAAPLPLPDGGVIIVFSNIRKEQAKEMPTPERKVRVRRKPKGKNEQST